MMSVRRVLVTGGAGFIGSHIVDALRAEKVDVVVLDNLDPAAHSVRPDYLRDDVEYQWGDCRNVDDWTAAMAGVDAVSHQAGKVGLGVDFGDVGEYVDHNDIGLASGLLALHRLGFTGPFVLASSMVVYGEGRYACADHGVVAAPPRSPARLEAGLFEPQCPHCGADLTAEPIPEDARCDPRNVYAATKLHQEHLLSAFAREKDVRPVMLRYHNVYGSRMPRDTPYAGVASIFRSAYEAGKAPRVTEDGDQRRDFVHVRDIARANVAALLSDDARGAFNVASGTPRSVGDMARSLGRAFGYSEGDECWPVVTGHYRLGDVRHVFASSRRLNHELEISPEHSFDDGMADFARAPLRQSVKPA